MSRQSKCVAHGSVTSAICNVTLLLWFNSLLWMQVLSYNALSVTNRRCPIQSSHCPFAASFRVPFPCSPANRAPLLSPCPSLFTAHTVSNSALNPSRHNLITLITTSPLPFWTFYRPFPLLRPMISASPSVVAHTIPYISLLVNVCNLPRQFDTCTWANVTFFSLISLASPQVSVGALCLWIMLLVSSYLVIHICLPGSQYSNCTLVDPALMPHVKTRPFAFP